jgi:hypothetical protein
MPHIVFQLFARYFLERRTIGIGLRHVRRLRLLSGVDFVEQLSDQAEGINLIVVLAGGETQQLGPQVRKPTAANERGDSLRPLLASRTFASSLS